MPQYTQQQDVEDIQYITFLLMARAGIRALEFYDPANKKHGQAHMQARYVYVMNAVEVLWLMYIMYRLGITQFLIEQGIAHLEEVRSSDGKLENLYVRVSITIL